MFFNMCSLCAFLFCTFFVAIRPLPAQETAIHHIFYNQIKLPLYPERINSRPALPSPYATNKGIEIVLAGMKDDTYALIPVTVENGTPLHYSRSVGISMGKDQQLLVNSGDFPALAKTGLHSEAELKSKQMITGFDVELITYIGRPGRFSGAGFLSGDEDILSVLTGDNRLVAKLGFTHPQMARPLFHVWNIILQEMELGNWTRYWDNIRYIFYNGRKVFIKAHGTKGWQISIFQDEIQGSIDIDVYAELSDAEKAFLKGKYPRLTAQELADLENKLTRIHFSEMAPYYIMRYGFYEGHTVYRSDPIALTFIFGIKSLEEIEMIFPGNLYAVLNNHFTPDMIHKQ
jgi:hypothetical protein